MKFLLFITTFFLLLPLSLTLFSHVSWSQKPGKSSLGEVTQSQKSNDKEAIDSQKRVSTIANEIRTTIEDYRLVNRKIDNTKIYNQQLRDLIQSQEDEVISIQKQTESLKNTNKEILPLISKMLENLEKFIALDTPFLKEERENRTKNLRAMMKRADVSTSEKYRRTLEAYQIENEYGRYH